MTAQITFDQLPVGACFRFADTTFEPSTILVKIADNQAYSPFQDSDDIVMNADDVVVRVRART